MTKAKVIGCSSIHWFPIGDTVTLLGLPYQVYFRGDFEVAVQVEGVVKGEKVVHEVLVKDLEILGN